MNKIIPITMLSIIAAGSYTNIVAKNYKRRQYFQMILEDPLDTPTSNGDIIYYNLNTGFRSHSKDKQIIKDICSKNDYMEANSSLDSLILRKMSPKNSLDSLILEKMSPKVFTDILWMDTKQQSIKIERNFLLNIIDVELFII